jgi:glycosyltransferase involved in cell wall biosynthesis
MKKLSIIIPVLNSHEIVRRQVLHFEKIGIPDDTELIIVDDGSDPALEIETTIPLTVLKTNDFRPWTWPVARNAGARMARGEYFLMTDLDHIISRELIDTVRSFTGDHMRFHREFAVLDENGDFTQDPDVLETYGWPRDRMETRGFRFTPHRNQFAIHKDLYWKIGGFREDRIGMPYPQREDGDFAKKWRLIHEAGGMKDFDEVVGYEHRPILYMFPNGKYCGDVDHNPFNLFHTLTRKTEANRFYKP